jgi:integrase
MVSQPTEKDFSAMGRKVREPALDTKSARAKLQIRKKPHYRSLGPGLHLGYRKGNDTRRWVARVYVANGAYTVEAIGHVDDDVPANGVTVLTFAQAQERARKLHAQRATAADEDAPRGPYTVRQAIEDYLSDVLHGKASENDTSKRLAAYVPTSLAVKECNKLTRKELLAWHRGLAEALPRARTKSGADKQNYRMVDLDDPEVARKRKVSANRIFRLLTAALNHAFREGKVASDATWRRVRPFKDVDQSRARYLTLAETKRLLNAADPEFRILARAALETGARYGHLGRLRVGDYNPDSGTLHIRPSGVRPGKAGKGFHIVLTAEGQAFVDELRAGRASSEPMLRREWKPSQQTRPMRAACVRAKIDPPIGFHQLRHTWASHAVMNGVPLNVVATNLGHADTRMVERHYGHLAPSYVADEIRKGAPRFGVKERSNVRAL